MIWAALLLGAISDRCANPALCPSDADLIAALHDLENRMLIELTSGPDIVLDVHFPKILGVKDVYCGKADPSRQGAINCKFTIRHPGMDEYDVAVLTKANGRWTIDERLNVNRRR
jgi:hypothetical protein